MLDRGHAHFIFWDFRVQPRLKVRVFFTYYFETKHVVTVFYINESLMHQAMHAWCRKSFNAQYTLYVEYDGSEIKDGFDQLRIRYRII